MNKRCALCGHPCAVTDAVCPICGGTGVLVPGVALPGGIRIDRVLSLTPRAIVYRVTSGNAPGPAALKVLRAPHGGVPAETLFPVLRVRHPGVVQAHRAGRGPDDLPFVLMDLLEGDTLRAHLEREGPLDPAIARDVAADLADAVAALHGSGIVHGSLSADGILVTRSPGRHPRLLPRLLDFRPAAPVRSRADDPASFPGTPVGPETDVQALGGLLYQAVAGVAPWHARVTDVPARRVVPMPLTFVCPTRSVSPDFDDLISRLVLAPLPGRLPTAAGVVSRLRRRDPRLRSVPSLTRTTGRFATVAIPSWSTDSVFRGPLREPVRLARRVEQPILDGLLRDTSEGRGTTVWFQGEEGSGLTTLGLHFLDDARVRGFATAAASASAPGPWFKVAEVLKVPAPPGDPDAIAGALLDAATAAPIAVFLDDFESADVEAAVILDRVCRRLEDGPTRLVVLVASRPLAPAPGGDRMALHRALGTVRGMSGIHVLAPLADRDVDILAESMCPFPCDAQVRARVRAVAGGNPLFVTRYLAHLVESGTLVVRDETLWMVPGADPGLPPDLAAAASGRTRRLRDVGGGEAALEVLARVALLEPWADLDALRALLVLEGAPARVAALDELLELLVREGFVRRVSVPARELLVMTRPPDREALTGLADVSAWTELVAAHVLRSVHDLDLGRIAEDLAGHYERGGFPDHGADCHLLAANRALREGRNAIAGERFQRAEALLEGLGDPEDARWEDVSFGLCEILTRAGRIPEAERRLGRGDARHDPAANERRRILHARLNEARGRLADAREAWALLEATSTVRVNGAQARVALALLDLGEGRPDLARGHLLQVEANGMDRLPERVQGLFLLAKGRLSASVGNVSEAFEQFARALGVLTAPSDVPDRARVLLERALLNLELGRADPALEDFRTGVALCAMTDCVGGLAGHLTGLGRVLARQGNEDEGRREILRAMVHRERLGAPAGVADVLVALGEMALDHGDTENARLLAQKAAGLVEKGGDVRVARRALLLLGYVAMTEGALQTAGRHVQSCLLTGRVSQEISVVLAEAHVVQARVRMRTGDADSARRHLMNAVVMFERLGLPLRAGEARALAAGE